MSNIKWFDEYEIVVRNKEFVKENINIVKNERLCVLIEVEIKKEEVVI